MCVNWVVNFAHSVVHLMFEILIVQNMLSFSFNHYFSKSHSKPETNLWPITSQCVKDNCDSSHDDVFLKVIRAYPHVNIQSQAHIISPIVEELHDIIESTLNTLTKDTSSSSSSSRSSYIFIQCKSIEIYFLLCTRKTDCEIYISWIFYFSAYDFLDINQITVIILFLIGIDRYIHYRARNRSSHLRWMRKTRSNRHLTIKVQERVLRMLCSRTETV